MERAKELADGLRRLADEVEAAGNRNDEVAFRATLIHLKALTNAFMPAQQLLEAQIQTEPFRLVLLRIGIEIGLFKALAKDELQPRSIADLAAELDVDALLLRRMIRFLATTGDLKKIDRENFANSTYTHVLATTPMGGGLRSMFDISIPCINKFPALLESTKYKSPGNKQHTAAHIASGGLTWFEWMFQDDQHMRDFSAAMATHDVGSGQWFTSHPLEDHILNGFDSSRGPLLVDVGGGEGRRIRAFSDHLQGKYPLVLQDLPTVLRAGARFKADNIDFMEHDFFKTQTVRGARVYYLRNVLHDWPDKEASLILQNIRDAMVPGYSRLLIDEMVLDEDDPGAAASMDMLMMILFAGGTRTADEWKALLEGAGIHFVKIWRDGCTLIEGVVS